MSRARFPCALLLLALAGLCAAAADARAATLYVNRLVVADPGDLSFGDLVRAVGDVPPGAGETLARTAAVITDRIVFIPVALSRGVLDDGFGRDSIIVGSRSLVVPRGSVPDDVASLLDRMVDFLAEKGVLGEDKVELEVVQTHLTGSIPRNAMPVFQLSRNARGTTEVSFSFSGQQAQPVSGKIVLAIRPVAAGIGEGVNSGDQVQVVFRRGPISIEMQGKALTTAAPGDKVSVFVPDSQKSFNGRVAGRKAVEVEIP